jgi:hypothetical protein
MLVGISRTAVVACALTLTWSVVGCADGRNQRAEVAFDAAAERYVKLALAVGIHAEDYVDAYHGPPEWRVEDKAEGVGLAEIRAEAVPVLADVDAVGGPEQDEMLRLRQRFLDTQLRSMIAYVDFLGGARSSFDDESRALYDAVAPTRTDESFDRTLAELDRLLPGEGSLPQRWQAFRDRFLIPEDRLEAVYRAAIDECRARTLALVDLPAGESFEIEFVTGASWGAYNWYQGDAHSLIQINTSLPTEISRAVGLACHEGYPGHHAYNALLEHQLVNRRGWVEFTVYPLYSPQSLLAEGTANFGTELVFSQDERTDFERDVLFPIAGLDPVDAELYYRALTVVRELDTAGTEAARRYVDGELDADQAAQWMVDHALYTRERAEQYVRFIDRYRSYVINYDLGRDLVRRWVERRAGSDDATARRTAFVELLTTPRVPSDLVATDPG